MKAFTISRYNKEDSLQLVDLPEPILKENEVLVEVHSASVNQLDAKIKTGEFKLLLPYKFPLILGHDVAGIIIKAGSKVNRFKVGDEVFARPADFKIGTNLVPSAEILTSRCDLFLVISLNIFSAISDSLLLCVLISINLKTSADHSLAAVLSNPPQPPMQARI